MKQHFILTSEEYGAIPTDSALKMAGPKLHGIYVTESALHYHGSITIDQRILELAGLLPMEFVNIWNKHNGSRISTYILPGEKDSGICCLNGAAARHCQVGDQLIVTSERFINRPSLDHYSTKILTFTDKNQVREVMSYTLRLSTNGCEFVFDQLNNESGK